MDHQDKPGDWQKRMRDCNAVIFDLGGVLLNLDYKATERGIRQILGPHSESYYTQTRQSTLFDDLETGRASGADFRDAIRKLTGTAVPDAVIDEAWNAMLGNLPIERMHFVQEVGKSRRLFLLSNTNEIHKAAFDPIVLRDLQGKSLDAYFEVAYYSHLMGRRKPDPEIYLDVTRRHGLDPARTLFIDDNRQNVEGAREAGLQAFHLQGELLTSELVNILR